MESGVPSSDNDGDLFTEVLSCCAITPSDFHFNKQFAILGMTAGSGSERNTPYSRGGQNNRSPSLGLSLRNMNNHGAIPHASGMGLTLRPSSDAGTGDIPVQSSQSNSHLLEATPASPSGPGTVRLTSGTSRNGLNAGTPGHLGEASDTTLPLTSEEQEFLIDLANQAGLDDQHLEYAQAQAEVRLAETVQGLAEDINTRTWAVAAGDGPGGAAAAGVGAGPGPGGAAAGRGVAAAGGPTPESHSLAVDPTTPWAASEILLDAISQLADKKVTLPLLESYTALKGTNRVWLAESLFNTVKVTIAKKSPEWKEEHLPRKVHGITDSRGVKRYHTDIKNACKHAREKMHISVLSGVYEAKVGVIDSSPVPDLKELNYIIGKGSSSIWAAVDRQLEILRLEEKRRKNHDGYKSGDYTASFYKIIYDQDCQYFSGTSLFQDLTNQYIFALPTEEQIEAGLPAVNVADDGPNEDDIMEM
ncbi:hypothetical protein DFH28DRAFT_1079155 [Melampsora americana]|nr:hypothetical protein DFH28DRAFT_1079155 [Melampsora americana]